MKSKQHDPVKKKLTETKKLLEPKIVNRFLQVTLYKFVSET